MTLKMIFGFGIFLIFGIDGYLMLEQAIIANYEIGQAENWKKKKADVLDVKIIDTNPDEVYRKHYSLEINYQFTVDGVSYSGNRMDLGPGYNYSNQESALEAVNEILDSTNRKKIAIFYNPQNPKESVINRGEKNYFLIIFGSLLFIFGIFSFRSGFMALQDIRATIASEKALGEEENR